VDADPLIEQNIERADHFRNVTELTAIGRDAEGGVLAIARVSFDEAPCPCA
jgi:formyltetrahydrofolate hydrolase